VSEELVRPAASLAGTSLGRYRLIRLIGRGGMGEVYEAEHEALGRRAAVKVLARRYAQLPEFRTRFIREGRAACRIRHRAIVDVYDVSIEGDQPYLVMELLEGEGLNHLLAREGKLSQTVSADFVVPIVAALAAVHDAGVVHRDLKPENVFLSRQARDVQPKILDFGISMLCDDGAPLELTAAGAFLGTPFYASPEQALPGTLPIGPATDQYAVGVLLYRLLTGRLPIEAGSALAALQKIAEGAFPPPTSIDPSIPRGFEDLILRAMARLAAARFPSMRALGRALLEFASERIREAYGVELSAPPEPRVDFSVNRVRAVRESDDGRANSFETALTVGDRWIGDPPAFRAYQDALPLATTPLVGREVEVREIVSRLQVSDVRLLTLVGPGGIGKSRLALEAAHRFLSLDSPVAGVANWVAPRACFVALAGVSVPASVLTAIAEAVGYRFAPTGDPKSQLCAFLRGQSRLLLVLDNFEHLLGATELLSEILATTAGVKLLVTSRERLQLTSETALSVSGLAYKPKAGEDLLQPAAVQLFLQTAKRVTADFEIGPSDTEHIARICASVEGVPLAVVLSASWISSLTPPEIAAEIDKSIDFLEAPLRDVPHRQRSMRAVFDRSWGLLLETERAAFSRLCLLRGSFRRETAEVVGRANLGTLAALVDKSLLRRNPETGRYEAHELLRQYGEARLRESTENLERTLQALSDHCLELLYRCEPALKSAGKKAELDELEPDLENLRVAWAWLVRHRRFDSLIRAGELLSLFLSRRAHFLEGQLLFERALAELTDSVEVIDGAGARALAALSAFHALFLQPQGRYADAVGSLTRALELLERSEDTGIRARVQLQLAMVLMSQGKKAEAIETAEAGLAICRTAGDAWGLANALLSLAELYQGSGELARAEQIHRESVAVQIASAGQVILPASLTGLAFISMHQGNYAEARDLMLRAIRMFEASGDIWRRMRCQMEVSYTLRNLGDYPTAQRYAEECVAFAKQTGNWELETWAHVRLGDILKEQDRIDAAEASYTAGLDLGLAFNNLRRIAVAKLNLGDIRALQGRLRQAREYFAESLRTFEEIDEKWGIVLAHDNLAYLDCIEGCFPSACSHFGRALEISLSLGFLSYATNIAAGIALLQMRTGRFVGGAELVAFVRQHPATEHQTLRRRLDPLLEELAGSLAAEELAAAAERGRALRIQDVPDYLAVPPDVAMA
jgi:serine/threonine protein kinase/predicted ATPase